MMRLFCLCCNTEVLSSVFNAFVQLKMQICHIWHLESDYGEFHDIKSKRSFVRKTSENVGSISTMDIYEMIIQIILLNIEIYHE